MSSEQSQTGGALVFWFCDLSDPLFQISPWALDVEIASEMYQLGLGNP